MISGVGWGFDLPYEEAHFQGHRLLVVVPGDLSDDAPVILALHGALGNGEESFGVFYPGTDFPPCLWLFPDGPVQVRQRSRRTLLTRHAWYDRFTHRYSDMKNSREFLASLLDHYSKWAVGEDGEGRILDKPRPVIIVGESQGGVMTFETGLNYPGTFLAMISVDGFIEYPEKTLARPLAPKRLPILMQNGTLDPVIQKEDAQATRSRLQGMGYHPLLRFYGVGHQITQRMKEDLWSFLRGVILEKSRLPAVAEGNP
ncbi:MAG TPA: hypothetical protein VHE12_07170 [bacterium]|nr:hypothetical protein [bacterium]